MSDLTIRRLVPAIAVLIFAASCRSHDGFPNSPPTNLCGIVREVIVSPTSLTLAVGDTGRLAATASFTCDRPPADGVPSKAWVVKDTSVARVAAFDGLFQARTVGTTQVYVVTGGVTAFASIAVVER